MKNSAAGARDAVRLLVTIGAHRPPGAKGFEDLVSQPRSVQRIEPRSAGDLAIVGYTSGTTGLPKGAMISQRALTACVRLMPSMFRISLYGRCAFTGTSRTPGRGSRATSDRSGCTSRRRCRAMRA